MTVAFTPIEKAVQEVIETWHPGKTGGNLSYTRGDGLLIVISLVPGAGRTDQVNGEWTVDLDVFGDNYLDTMGVALDLEAKLLGAPFVTSGMIVDSSFQTISPAPLPWEDDEVTRLGLGFVFTARRKG